MSLRGAKADLGGDTDITVDDYTTEIVRSGFPAIRRHSGRLLRAALDGYLDRVAERDTADVDHPIRDTGALRRRLTAYAAATSTAATFETARDAASAGQSHKPARSTAQPYRATLKQLWLIEEAPAWRPTRNHLRRLAAAPIHQLADPALAARLLGCDKTALLRDPPPARPCPATAHSSAPCTNPR